MKRFIGGLSFGLALLATGPAPAQLIAELRAGDGTISSPFILTNGFVFQPLQTTVTNGGRAVYSFTVPSTGQYAISAVVEAPTQHVASVCINVDAEPNSPETRWEIPARSCIATNWVSAPGTVGPKWFSLASGEHQLIIRGTEPNVKLSRICIASPPKPPTGLHVVNGP